MDILNAREGVEQFHLLFLEQLGHKLDKKFYCLKGGCNLRFFFKSPRYSEDLDLDIRITARETLKKNIRRILEGTPFTSILKARGLTMASISEPKQTDTTQRWKLTLNAKDLSLPLHTKIEFSRRGLSDDTLLEPVDATLIRQYRLSPFLVHHYGPKAAYEQKLSTLLNRSETQARDVFDLHLLLAWQSKPPVMPSPAANKIRSISFDDFKGQVIAYLSPEFQKQYDSKMAWNHLIQNLLGTSNTP